MWIDLCNFEELVSLESMVTEAYFYGGLVLVKNFIYVWNYVHFSISLVLFKNFKLEFMLTEIQLIWCYLMIRINILVFHY